MSLRFAALLVVCALPGSALGQDAKLNPKMTTVEPATGKAGDVITVSGENLGKDLVAEVYLTDGKNDYKLQIVEQADSAVKIKLPGKITGRFSFMLLTKGKDARLIEEPVKVEVE